ncbi:hypothetical protein LTR78_001167 [Recurvomyces mirabilis]|uniref:Uncharacterized protein n=1 Tax=Recurvomyces mirabilis TaxID=574656 RepID=A0AAE0WVQ5_9PEZI|nr:hypothetical protein LTR78_001167 [Recurvomyces mirabilis]KAK5161143.1 hypothetical protein LTS14_000939 [Recurvomyces mirabilis]
MDKLKSVAKGGWKPAGDPKISRDTWKEDLKGMATGKKSDPHEATRNHTSAPLKTLKDPDSFGAPPKHTGVYGNAANVPSSSSAYSEPSGGLGSPIPTPSRRQQQEVVEEEEVKGPPKPYSKDTTGLRTDNLPKPPIRRGDAAAGSSSSPARTASPSLPPRQTPGLPTRQASRPPPSLPPRMTENPSEWTPAPPPTYGEATQSPIHDPAAIAQGAATRLSQAGVSVPGFGIGSPTSSTQPQAPSAPRGPQLTILTDEHWIFAHTAVCSYGTICACSSSGSSEEAAAASTAKEECVA